MTRRTVDVGIDLGTTNSAVAVMVDGQAQVISTADGTQYMPSYVAVNERGELEVGQAAKRIRLTDSDNAAEGFKRHLGTDEKWRFPRTGTTFTAEDLSACVLRSLKQDVVSFLNEEVDAAVITVPAVFGEREKDAVLTAARSAGFIYATLVQEPVAAGLACGWNDPADSIPFLVYDIGGGTFDVSLMQVIGGQLVVRMHRGEHTLGGRELDDAIVTNLIWPRLQDRVEGDERNRSLLSFLAESAKIRLSRFPSATVAIEGRLRDRQGQPVEDVIQIQREEYEPLVRPLVERTVEIVRGLLDEAGVGLADLKGVVLVGGPSQAPTLRRALEQALAPAPLETRIDPMTIVAQGAALHAASIPLPNARGSEHRDSGKLPIRIEYPPVATDATVRVGVAGVGRRLPEGANVRIARDDGLWQSGLVPVRDGRAITEVSLGSVTQSRFRILLYGPDDSVLEVEPDEFVITFGLSAAPPPLSRSIGVDVDEALGGTGFHRIAERGLPTPLTRRKSFRTTREINAGDDEAAISVVFREGESQRPDRNQIIGEVRIRGTDVLAALPVDSEVEIILAIDPCREAKARVRIPLLDWETDTALEVGRETLPSESEMAQDLALELSRMEKLAGAGVDAGKLVRLTDEVAGNLAVAGDRDARRRAFDGLHRLQREMDSLETAQAPRLALEELEEVEALVERITRDFGDPADISAFERLQKRSDTARLDGHVGRVRQVEEEMLDLGRRVYWSQTGAWVARFQELADCSEFKDPQRAQTLVAEGRRALEAGDRDMLRRVVIDLWGIASEEAGAGAKTRFLIGLRRSQT